MTTTEAAPALAKPPWSRLGLYLLGFVGAALALNGWIFSTGAVRWARTLANPTWSPPGPVIGTVWVVLFALMAGALFELDRAKVNGDASLIADANRAQRMIYIQYAINMFWTIGYFGLRNVANGFYVTVVAWLFCVAVLAACWPTSRRAAAFILPLQGWLTFALALSWTTWRMNLGA